MNEEPKGIGRKSWNLPRSFLGRLVYFVVLALLITCLVVPIIIGLALKDWMPICVIGGITLAVILICVLFRLLSNRRYLRRMLFGFACLITLIALFYAEEDWRGWRAWNKFKTDWEAKGEKFDVASLAPPPVPDDQNFAMCPLLKPIMDFTRTTNGVRWRDTNALARLEGLSASLRSHGSKNAEGNTGNLDKGTFTDLESWRVFYRGNTNYPQPVKPGTAAQDVLVALGKFDPEVRQLLEAAATRPYCRFPIEYNYEMPFAVLLPHLAKVKQISQLLDIRVIAELQTGETQEAFAELKLAFRFSDLIKDEPILIDHLVRLATMNLGLQALREGLARHAWSDAQLAELEKYLAGVNLLAEYELALRGERACEVGGLDWLRRRGFRESPGVLVGTDSGSFSTAGFNVLPSGFYYQNMLTMARMHQELTIPVVDEHTHRVFPDKSGRDEVELQSLQRGFHPYSIFARILFPALGRAAVKSSRMQACVDAAQVACALERCRLANGQLPDTLAALVPRLIERIPNDVIDGQPLRYDKKPDGSYLVYSIGWNQKDDGGEIVLTKDGKGVDPLSGDWVWQLPAK